MKNRYKVSTGGIINLVLSLLRAPADLPCYLTFDNRHHRARLTVLRSEESGVRECAPSIDLTYGAIIKALQAKYADQVNLADCVIYGDNRTRTLLIVSNPGATRERPPAVIPDSVKLSRIAEELLRDWQDL